MNKLISNLGYILGTVILLVIITLLIALPIMWLWNWLMPAIFGLIKINFWQALGISLLCTFLFKTNVNISKN